MQILKGHTGVVPGLAFSPDGARLASAGCNGLIHVWRFPAGQKEVVLAGAATLSPTLSFSPDGRWLAVESPNSGAAAWVYDLTSPSRPVMLQLSDGAPESQSLTQWMQTFDFTPGGREFVIVGEKRRWNDQGQGRRFQALVRRFEVGSWAELSPADFDIPSDRYWRPPWALHLRKSLLATPDQRCVIFWDLGTGQELFRHSGKSHAEPGGLTFSADGSRLALSRTRLISVYDVPGRRLLTSWKNPTTKYVQSLAFSPDGRTLISVSNDTAARLWDADTGHEKAAYAWQVGPLKAVAFAADGMRAAASGKDGDIVVWDID